MRSFNVTSQGGHPSRWRTILAGLAAVGVGFLAAGASWSAETAPAPATGTQESEAQAVLRAEALLDVWSVNPDDADGAQAKAVLDGVLVANAGSAAAHREYARYHIRQAWFGDRAASLARAQASLDQARALSPSFAEAYVLQGHLDRLRNRPAEGRIALQKAEELGTSDPWLDLNWADILLDAGEYAAAVPRCQRVLKKSWPREVISTSAEQCLITAYFGLRRLDDAEAAYRAQIARRPQHPSPRTRYAAFLLCNRSQPENAIASATSLSALADYPSAREVVVAARYRLWAREVTAGHVLAAGQAWEEAIRASRVHPAAVVAKVCTHNAAAIPVLRAMRDVRRGELLSPMLAVLAAAELADEDASEGFAGIFAFKVAASGRQSDNIYLNSQADYRDQRNLSVRFTAKSAEAFHALHGGDPDTVLDGKWITVVGIARRTRVDFSTGGLPTGRYYYQTQVSVSDAADVRIEEPYVPSPEPEAAKPILEA